jgi:hypothetical protein
MARKNGNGKRPARGMQAPYLTKGGKGTLKKKKMSLADRARKGLGEFTLPPPIGSVGTHIQTAKALYSLAKKAKQRGPLRSRRN